MIVPVNAIYAIAFTATIIIFFIFTKGQCLIATERTPLGFTCSLTVLHVFYALMKAYTTTPGACKYLIRFHDS